MQIQPSLPEFLSLPTIDPVHSPVAVVTVPAAQHLIASVDLTLNGAKQLFNPDVWPQLEPDIRRIPFDRPKAQCFRDCVAYLMKEASTLRSERRHIDALKYIEVAITLEALVHGYYGDA